MALRHDDSTINIVVVIIAINIITININTPIDTMWSAIKGKLLKLMEVFVPKKLSSTHFSQPWTIREVKCIVARKKRWYRIAQKSKPTEHFQKYKALKKEVKEA